MSVPRKLTSGSSLDNLKKEAKRWLKALQSGEPEARVRLERAVPRAPAMPGLREVQHALALEYGFPGWTALKHALAEAVPAERSREETVQSFLRNASLDWRVGGSLRISCGRTAERLLHRHPDIARDSVYTAVVYGDRDEVARRLAGSPEAASAPGGPREWPPLLYLCSTRLSHPAANQNAVAIARLLLDHGADPNVFYPGGDESIHYTALTCVAGEGEEDAPPHPAREALWELLLERGAEPYDNQTLYNTHFRGDVLWYLKLMYARAIQLGRQADWDDPNWPMLDMGGYGNGARYFLGNAIQKNDLVQAEWLLAHGAGANAPPSKHPRASKRSLYEEAASMGQTEMAELLARYGAPRSLPALEGMEAFTAASFRLDREAARALAQEHPEYLKSHVTMHEAAQRGRADVVKLLLELGTSVEVQDASGSRTLHHAAYHDATDLISLLLERGAEVDPKETNHDGTPLAWAVYGKRDRAVELLSRVSRDVWELTWAGSVERLRELLHAEPELARVGDSMNTLLMWLPDNEVRAMSIVRLLLAKGADPSVTDAEGRTAADIARRRGMDEIADLIEAAPVPTTPRAPDSAPTPAELRALEGFEELATDLVAGYHGDAEALERLKERFGRSLTLETLRAQVQQRRTRPPDGAAETPEFDLVEARLIIARNYGYGSINT